MAFAFLGKDENDRTEPLAERTQIGCVESTRTTRQCLSVRHSMNPSCMHEREECRHHLPLLGGSHYVLLLAKELACIRQLVGGLRKCPFFVNFGRNGRI